MDLIPVSEYIPSPTPTSKYNAERNGLFTSLEDIQKDKEAQAKSDNNYINLLNSDYDKVKADTNGDGKVDYNEYKAYLISSNEVKPSVLQSRVQEDNNNNTNQNYYHFDYSLLIAIGMVCITTIIVTWIKKIKSS